MKRKITNQFEKKVKWISTFIIAICLLSNFNGFAQLGAALNLLNDTEYVTLPSAISTSSLVGGSNITVEAWVNPTSLAGNAVIVGNYNNNSNQMQFLLRRDNSQFSFWVGTGVGAVYTGTLSAAGTVTTNVWQHVAGVYDGTLISVYINGVLSATASASYTFSATTNVIRIGRNNIAENYIGSLDEIRIWNVARKKCNINTYMNCEIPSSFAGLIANYHFNEGIASGNNATITALTDATTNNFTGTLTAFALTGSTSNWIAPGGVVSGFTTSLAPPDFTATSLSICAGNTLALSGTSGDLYTWSTGVTNGVAFTPTASSSYTFSGTNTVSSCSNTVVASVTVNPIPFITVNSGSICSGSSFTVLPGGAITYTIQGGNAVVSPTSTSSYSVTGTSSAGCVSQSVAVSNVTVLVCTGLNELTDAFASLNLYPNPSNGVFTIDLPDIADIKIFNNAGQIIYSEKMNSGKNQVNIDQYSNGIYTIQISNSENKVIYRLGKH